MSVKVSRPLEYVAVFQVEMSTQEGNFYIYCAVDSFSGHLFQTGIETDRNPENVLRHVQLLIDLPEFKQVHSKYENFKLVFHKYQELKEEINTIINPIGGTMLVNDEFVAKAFNPVIKHFYSFISKEVEDGIVK